MALKPIMLGDLKKVNAFVLLILALGVGHCGKLKEELADVDVRGKKIFCSIWFHVTNTVVSQHFHLNTYEPSRFSDDCSSLEGFPYQQVSFRLELGASALPFKFHEVRLGGRLMTLPHPKVGSQQMSVTIQTESWGLEPISLDGMRITLMEYKGKDHVKYLQLHIQSR